MTQSQVKSDPTQGPRIHPFLTSPFNSSYQIPSIPSPLFPHTCFENKTKTSSFDTPHTSSCTNTIYHVYTEPDRYIVYSILVICNCLESDRLIRYYPSHLDKRRIAPNRENSTAGAPGASRMCDCLAVYHFPRDHPRSQTSADQLHRLCRFPPITICSRSGKSPRRLAAPLTGSPSPQASPARSAKPVPTSDYPGKWPGFTRYSHHEHSN
jgi:hypothetical protein